MAEIVYLKTSVNYRKILKCYMAAILREEGFTYVDDLMKQACTADEFAAYKQAKSELADELLAAPNLLSPA